MSTTLVTDLTIFILALLVGIEVIGKVPATLHTPLMSATNSIHGIVLAGALLIGVTANNAVGYILAFIASFFAAANVVGGYVVTVPAWISRTKVAMTAMIMPVTATWLPRRAVAGLFIRCSPTTKHAAAST